MVQLGYPSLPGIGPFLSWGQQRWQCLPWGSGAAGAAADPEGEELIPLLLFKNQTTPMYVHACLGDGALLKKLLHTGHRWTCHRSRYRSRPFPLQPLGSRPKPLRVPWQSCCRNTRRSQRREEKHWNPQSLSKFLQTGHRLHFQVPYCFSYIHKQ